MRTRARTSKRLVLLVCAAAVILGGCASVEHINVYRGTRGEFNAASQQHNARVLGDAFAALDTAAGTSLDISGGIAGWQKVADLQAEADGWQDVYEQARALNSRAERDLRADGLYGASRTLEIVARTRASVCRHLLSGAAGTRPATQPATQRTEPVTAAVAEADRLLADSSITMFPRDRYMLQSLRPVVRYEVAVVNARRAVAAGTSGDRAAIGPIAADIATAEREHADGTAYYPRDALAHAILARLIMLQAGTTLVKGEAFLHDTPPLDAATYAEPGIKRLAERVEVFRTAAVQPGTPEHDLVERLRDKRPAHIEPADLQATLTRIGLETLMPDRPQP